MTNDAKCAVVLTSLINLMKNEYGDFDDFETNLCIYQHLNFIKSTAEAVDLPLSEIELNNYELPLPNDVIKKNK